MNKSEQLDQLFTALAKAQGDIEMAERKAANPFFKSSYADLAEIVRVSRPHLVKNGLCVTQWMEDGFFYTLLGHASGQWIQSKLPITPAKSDIQALGSYISYLRRYSYAALIGVVDGTSDDDGESQMERTSHQPQQTYYKPPVTTTERIDASQVEELDIRIMRAEEATGRKDGEISSAILTKYNLAKLDNLMKSNYREVLNRLEELEKTTPKAK